ncbi:MAG: DNA replication and repair protein RecF [Mariprofundaceae bacterium]|nr:DNA replication and repair protein RecF [Mariprofundaceae bacterium]
MHKSLPIWLGYIHIQDLRCHQQQQWNLEAGVNLFIGENGCGKTSVLEATYLMAHGRSFRQARDPELVRWNCAQFHIRGTWHRYGPLHVQIHGKRRKTEMLLQGRKLNNKKVLAETLLVLVDAPQGKKLIDGVSNERRKWLDHLVMFCEPAIKAHYHAYLRALMQRTRVLRKQPDTNELLVWEAQMIFHGRYIKEYRDKICILFNALLCKEKALTEKYLQMEIKSHVPDNDAHWSELLQNKRQQDSRMGRCSSGPHADKLHITFSGKEIRAVGSRGQQKLASIAMKLAECGLIEQYRQIWPVLLLDDCFEALDEKRCLHLIQRLCDYPGQVLATSPNYINTSSELAINVWPVHVAQQQEDSVEESVEKSVEKNNTHRMISHKMMESIV